MTVYVIGLVLSMLLVSIGVGWWFSSESRRDEFDIDEHTFILVILYVVFSILSWIGVAVAVNTLIALYIIQNKIKKDKEEVK